MIDSRALQQVLGSLKPAPWEGRVYRLMLGDYPPDRENTSGARWNPPDVAAIYTSLQAATAIAEVEYHLAHQPRPVRRDLRKTLYELHIELAAVLDLTSALTELSRVGAGRDQLFADDMRLAQEIGRTVTWFGFGGLLVHSARADGLNLIVYPSHAAGETFRLEITDRKTVA